MKNKQTQPDEMCKTLNSFKSINVREDLLVPDRASHYYPTRKSLDIITAVLGGFTDENPKQGSIGKNPNKNRASIIIAPYGSGKSLAALVAGLLVRADPADGAVFKPIIKRLQRLNPTLAANWTMRLKSDVRGTVIALSGLVPDLPLALTQALGLENPGTLEAALKVISNHLSQIGHDRLALIWDESGNHPEQTAESYSQRLLDIQYLAEWAVRNTGTITTFTLLSHRDFQNHGPHSADSESSSLWRRIEGRFDIIRMIEDSDEIYDFIAETISGLNIRPVNGSNRAGLARQTIEAGFFIRFSPIRLESLLYQACPLTPGAFWLLPRLSARISQNERSIFSFLSELFGTEPVGFEALFVYFSEAMRQDTGSGGVYRQFLEVEYARARARPGLEANILAALCLLSLVGADDGNAGSGANRIPVTRTRLVAALLTENSHDIQDINNAIDRLIEAGLVLHGVRSDDIRIWHGADIDLQGKIQDLMLDLAPALDMANCLAELIPPSFHTSPEYNFNHGLTRYAPVIYTEFKQFRTDDKRQELVRLTDENDAVIVLVLDAVCV